MKPRTAGPGPAWVQAGAGCHWSRCTCIMSSRLHLLRAVISRRLIFFSSSYGYSARERLLMRCTAASNPWRSVEKYLARGVYRTLPAAMVPQCHPLVSDVLYFLASLLWTRAITRLKCRDLPASLHFPLLASTHTDHT